MGRKSNKRGKKRRYPRRRRAFRRKGEEEKAFGLGGGNGKQREMGRRESNPKREERGE